MGSIRITAFGGIKPRLMRGSGGPTSASVAKDVKLWHGSISPWRYPAKTIETNQTSICTLFQMGCCFVGSDKKCADFATGDVNCPRVFSTGHMPWPAYATLPACSGADCGEYVTPTWCRLGIPSPINAPTIIGTPLVTPGLDACVNCDSSNQRKRESRAYFYTFVNEYGEESHYSPITNIFDADTDAPVTLGFSIPPMANGYCNPTHIRIYRAGSSTTDEGEWDTSSADFFLVDEIPYQSGNFTRIENTPADSIGPAYQEDCQNSPPPEKLMNITALPDGVLVGSVGKRLWFSEPWKFHSWDCFLELDDCIKAIKVHRDMIYVATDGYPYVVDVKSNDKECRCCRSINRLSEPAPIMCKTSMVTTNTGVMWASDIGLVRMAGNEFSIDTHDYMAEDDWRQWYPHDLKGVFYKGQYYGFNAERGFIWSPLTGAYNENFPGEFSRLSTLSLTPTAIYRSDQNILYMVFNGDIFKWDSAAVYMPYTWRSKLHIEGGLQNYSAAKVVFEKYLRSKKSPHPVNMRLYADDKLIFERKITCGKPFRLPKGYDALNWEIEVSGIEQINEIHIATSMSELAMQNNSG